MVEHVGALEFPFVGDAGSAEDDADDECAEDVWVGPVVWFSGPGKTSAG